MNKEFYNAYCIERKLQINQTRSLCNNSLFLDYSSSNMKRFVLQTYRNHYHTISRSIPHDSHVVSQSRNSLLNR